MTAIALVGNPNSGKTTLFNQLTGNRQHTGNWPGVTVERKAGTIKGTSDVELVDLPGIYSLSPYTKEEIVARDYLAKERPDVILDIVDASNLERNLYLTTQLMEFGIPVVVALNQMDIVRKRGDEIDTAALSDALGLPVVEISALLGEGLDELVAELNRSAAKGSLPTPIPFPSELEQLVVHLEESLPATVPAHLKRFYAIKYLEQDKQVMGELGEIADLHDHIRAVEARYDDKADAVITNARYDHITGFMKKVLKREEPELSTTEKIDRIVLNRVLALPIFVAVIVAIYYISITTVGTVATDWANDGVFGEGWFLDPVAIVNPEASAQAAYDADAEPYDEAQAAIDEYLAAAEEAGIDTSEVAKYFGSEAEEADSADSAEAQSALAAFESQASKAGLIADFDSVDEESTFETDYYVYCGAENLAAAETAAEARNDEIAANGRAEAAEAVAYSFDGTVVDEESGEEVPQGIAVPAPKDKSAYGIWIPGIPTIVGGWLESIGCTGLLYNLIMDGIIAGVGAVLGFVPQIMILFFLLAILEGCGYMARVTFILDRMFRRFGLSGKTFIPMIVGTGCGTPGIMASRTIESASSRRLTIMTTTFMPCSAKLPIIALISTAIFAGAWWVAPTAYFMGIASIVMSGIILKKTKPFLGETTPYIMELPEYRMPRFVDLLRSMWERAWSFIKKAGTVILAAVIIVWFLSGFGFYEGQFMWVGEELMDHSLLAGFGNLFAWVFAPLGFNNWQAAATVVTGLLAKENVIGTMAVVFGGTGVAWPSAFMASLATTTGSAALVAVAAFSFMTFQLLCAPCFAAMGAIKREMGGMNKWFWAAIGWECGWAYAIALCIYQFGRLAVTGTFDVATIAAFVVAAAILFGLFRPAPKVSDVKDSGPTDGESAGSGEGMRASGGAGKGATATAAMALDTKAVKNAVTLGCSGSCSGCAGCENSATAKNALMPVFKPL